MYFTGSREAAIAKNRNTYAKRQREQEKREKADRKRAKRDRKREPARPADSPDATSLLDEQAH